jgi:selenocysteine lyase/cysteine desulfurase
VTEAEIRALFPGVERRRYFNAAAAALIPTPVAEAVRDAAERQVRDGIHAFPADMAAVQEARERSARRIGAPVRDVALVSGTADGIARVAGGFPWRPGDEVVLGDLEYPANVYPWAVQADRGVRLKVVPSEDGRLPAARLIDAIGPRTRVVAVSMVQFTSGYRVDLAALAEACRERDVFLAVDAIQGLGVLPVDVTALDIGCLVADGRKWLFGPAGCAVLYVAHAWAVRMRPPSPGALSVENADEFLQWTRWTREDGTLETGGRWRDGAGRFESGFPNTVGAAGLAAALATGERIGPQVIHDRVCRFAARLAAAVGERGWRVHGPRDDTERAGIVAFEPPGDAAELWRALSRDGYSLALRDGRLRAAPHVYNRADEIDDLVEAIARRA